MRGFVQGADRQQTTLLPECLDDWIDESNSIRAVDVFVEALDLRDLGFEGVNPAATGRPAYHPSPMLKLYIYGYLNRVQSSRRLEREAGRNVEVMWLTGRLAPDHKTIADFRKDNGPAIKKVCAQFVELCRKMGLLAKASVAIDGSKFKAVNSRDNNFTQGKIQRRQKQIEESVARYMSQLDTADRQTAAGEEPSETVLLTKTRLKEKLAKLEEEVKRLAAIEKALLASPDKQISRTDPDCRSMATSGRGSGMVAYNMQSVVDTTNHLIVAHEVTNVGSDRSQLATMAQAAKAALRSDNLEGVADRGYLKGEEIRACEQAGVAVTLPKPQTSGAKLAGRFGKPDFVYLAKDDVYRCPAGEKLEHHFTADEDGLTQDGVPMSDTTTVSPLRQRMIEDMAARKLNPHTQRSHIQSCKRFAAWLKRSPDAATPDEVRGFQLHLIESGTSICNRNRIMTGVRFLFRVTLRRHDLAAEIWHIKEPERLLPVLSHEEVKRVLTMATSLKARAMLTLAYGCGLRAGEVVRLRAGDIDSEQMIIRIVQSKGRKDRHVMLPAEVLELLRQWWKARPTERDAGVAPEQRWLFPGRDEHRPLTTRQFSRLFKEAAKAAGVRETLFLFSRRPSL